MGCCFGKKDNEDFYISYPNPVFLPDTIQCNTYRKRTEGRNYYCDPTDDLAVQNTREEEDVTYMFEQEDKVSVEEVNCVMSAKVNSKRQRSPHVTNYGPTPQPPTTAGKPKQKPVINLSESQRPINLTLCRSTSPNDGYSIPMEETIISDSNVASVQENKIDDDDDDNDLVKEVFAEIGKNVEHSISFKVPFNNYQNMKKVIVPIPPTTEKSTLGPPVLETKKGSNNQLTQLQIKETTIPQNKNVFQIENDKTKLPVPDQVNDESEDFVSKPTLSTTISVTPTSTTMASLEVQDKVKHRSTPSCYISTESEYKSPDSDSDGECTLKLFYLSLCLQL